MQRLRTVTLLDVSAVAGHHAMPAALLFFLLQIPGDIYIFNLVSVEITAMAMAAAILRKSAIRQALIESI